MIPPFARKVKKTALPETGMIVWRHFHIPVLLRAAVDEVPDECRTRRMIVLSPGQRQTLACNTLLTVLELVPN